MGIAASMLPEFDHEMVNTRKTLERVPTDKFAWKPHEKSFPMGALATHVANLASWTNVTIDMEVLDMAPGGVPIKTPECQTTEELLSMFDSNVAKARATLEAATDEHLFKNWSLEANGQHILTMPRVAVLRGFVMNHLIHHRAQLGVYLRLNDIPVPSIYGPSADEMM
jgi:uncharacterized damage-inducible protein DinB